MNIPTSVAFGARFPLRITVLNGEDHAKPITPADLTRFYEIELKNPDSHAAKVLREGDEDFRRHPATRLYHPLNQGVHLITGEDSGIGTDHFPLNTITKIVDRIRATPVSTRTLAVTMDAADPENPKYVTSAFITNA